MLGGCFQQLSCTATSTSGILPHICIICKKVDAYVKRAGKRTRDIMFKTQTLDGGLLREAATKKEDESILKHIRGKDCVAIEVRYHQSCYKKYVIFISRKSSNVSEPDSPEYQETFEVFGRDVVRTRIILEDEVLYMSKLLEIFKQMVLKIENLNASNFSSVQLKKRLQEHFPQLVFHRLAKRVKSDMVFVDDISRVSVEKLKSLTSESTETEMESSCSETNIGAQRTQTFDDDTLHCLYTSAMKLRGDFLKISTGSYEGPWPPLASDVAIRNAKSMIPIELYNILAWTIGASNDPTLEYYVEVEESVDLKLISILQGIILLQYKGRTRTLT